VFTRKELGKSINTDEAAALGASYQAAHLSKGYKVKKFAIKDANLFPIQVILFLLVMLEVLSDHVIILSVPAFFCLFLMFF